MARGRAHLAQGHLGVGCQKYEHGAARARGWPYRRQGTGGRWRPQRCAGSSLRAIAGPMTQSRRLGGRAAKPAAAARTPDVSRSNRIPGSSAPRRSSNSGASSYTPARFPTAISGEQLSNSIPLMLRGSHRLGACRVALVIWVSIGRFRPGGGSDRDFTRRPPSPR